MSFFSIMNFKKVRKTKICILKKDGIYVNGSEQL